MKIHRLTYPAFENDIRKRLLRGLAEFIIEYVKAESIIEVVEEDCSDIKIILNNNAIIVNSDIYGAKYYRMIVSQIAAGATKNSTFFNLNDPDSFSNICKMIIDYATEK